MLWRADSGEQDQGREVDPTIVRWMVTVDFTEVLSPYGGQPDQAHLTAELGQWAIGIDKCARIFHLDDSFQ